MVDVKADADPLAPRELAKLLSTLAIAQATVVDLVLGRPCSRAHVAAVRNALTALDGVLTALEADGG